MKKIFTLKIITMIAWSISLGLALSLAVYNQGQHSLDIAHIIAKANFDKDQVIRLWATRHGGVYVPVDMNRTPPSPYLSHLPHRDVETKSEKKLTLMNPAYMLRQMMQEYSGLYGSKSHITALEVLNPISKPDKWEKQALEKFRLKNAAEEILEITHDEEKESLRLIRPMQVIPECLKCHGHQASYLKYPTVGGVSITVPMQEINTLARGALQQTVLLYLLFYSVGMLLISIVFGKEEKAKQRVKELLEESERMNIDLDDKAKELEYANKCKSEFLANISHEIRTPLNSIVGFTQHIKKQNRDKKIDEYIKFIDYSSKNLLHIIGDVLDISQIDKGKLNLKNMNFDLRKELTLFMQPFKTQCLEKKIHFSVSFSERTPSIISADALRIKQVVLNLIDNAIKFSYPKKSILFTVDYKDKNLYISVLDEGKGISKEKLNDIFEAFNQEDNSTTREYSGVGLGLSISKKLVSLMGGELKVRSKVNEGSEFYFSIPVEISDNIPQEKEDEIIVEFEGKRALIVEDDNVNQIFMKIVLEDMGFDIDICENGKEAFTRFQDTDYDVVLMDENMPNMSGIEVTRKILAYEKEKSLKHTPIIAVTANSLKGDRERFLEVGMDEYISKPIDMKKLNVIFKTILSTSNRD